MLKVLASLVMILICGITIAQPHFAKVAHVNKAARVNKVEVARERLAKLRHQIQLLEQQISQSRRLQGDTLASIRESEQRLAAISVDLATKLKSQTLLEKKISLAKQSQAQLNEKINVQQQQITQLMPETFAQSQQQQLRVLFSADEYAQKQRIFVYHAYVQRARIARIKDLIAQKHVLETINTKISAKRVALRLLRQQQAVFMIKWQDERKQRDRVLGEIEHKIKEDGRNITDLQRSEQELLGVLGFIEEKVTPDLSAGPRQRDFNELRGKLPWPVKGVLVKPFAYKPREFTLHTRGILVEASLGAQIKAVAAGRVVFANWLGNFGLVIIIDHGNNYLSLYAHLQNLQKNLADEVVAGETIAQVGDSGGQKRAALYFELRHKNSSLNPMQWVSAKSR